MTGIRPQTGSATPALSCRMLDEAFVVGGNGRVASYAGKTAHSHGSQRCGRHAMRRPAAPDGDRCHRLRHSGIRPRRRFGLYPTAPSHEASYRLPSAFGFKPIVDLLGYDCNRDTSVTRSESPRAESLPHGSLLGGECGHASVGVPRGKAN